MKSKVQVDRKVIYEMANLFPDFADGYQLMPIHLKHMITKALNKKSEQYIIIYYSNHKLTTSDRPAHDLLKAVFNSEANIKIKPVYNN